MISVYTMKLIKSDWYSYEEAICMQQGKPRLCPQRGKATCCGEKEPLSKLGQWPSEKLEIHIGLVTSLTMINTLLFF